MSVTSSIGMLSSNLDDLEKSLSVLTEKLCPILIPEPPKGILDVAQVESVQSTLSQDILKFASIVNDLNIKCSSLISRMDIL